MKKKAAEKTLIKNPIMYALRKKLQKIAWNGYLMLKVYLGQIRLFLKTRKESRTAIIYMKTGLSVTLCSSEQFDTNKSEIKIHRRTHVQNTCKYVLLHSNNDEKCVTWEVISLNLQPIQLGKKINQINSK